MFPGFKIEDHDKFRDIYDFLVAKSKESEDERERTLSFASFEFKNPHRLFVEYSSKPQSAPFGLHRYFTSNYVHGMGVYGKLRAKFLDFMDFLSIETFFVVLLLLFAPVILASTLGIAIFIALMEFALHREIKSLEEGLLIEAYSDKEFFHELVESKELAVISYVNSESFELS